MADVTITDYIKILGKQAKNQQKLLSYYGELYEFYNDKLPKNKYIYYLEENPYTEPFSTLSPNTHDFFSMGSKKLSMLTPYIRIFKKFKGKKGKKIEIPFENRTNLILLMTRLATSAAQLTSHRKGLWAPSRGCLV